MTLSTNNDGARGTSKPTIPTPDSNITERSPSSPVCCCIEAFMQMRRARETDRQYAQSLGNWDPELALVEVAS